MGSGWAGSWPDDAQIVHPYLIVDVFTSTPLEGNALAVFPEGAALSDDVMRRGARELNLSETAFVLPAGNEADARIRIFTPARELPFAGHPVIGTAIVLGERRASDTIRLETGIGTITVELEYDGGLATFGRMHQPVPSVEPHPQVEELLAALGVGGALLPVEQYRNGPAHAFVALDSPGAVGDLRPDLGRLAAVAEGGVSCFARDEKTWRVRVFAPSLGVPEDPATGSAAGPLAVHLVRHGWIQPGKEVEIRQGAEIGRPSVIYARADGSAQGMERVMVGGAAVIVAQGEYRLT